jgi:hypothetical protein
MSRLPLLCLSLLVVFAASACGSVRPTLSVSKPGVSDIEGEREIVDRYAKAISDSIEVPKEEVIVLVSALPEGISYNQETMTVEEGYDHELLATFEFMPSNATPYWFADYRAGWRKGLCYPQVPLSWVTLGIWPTFVPTAWPCWGTPKNDKLDMLQDVRRVGASAGGDTVILQMVEWPGSDSVIAARGFVLRADPRVRATNFERRRDLPKAPPKDI